MKRGSILVCFALSLLASVSSCQRPAPQIAPPEPPVVPVSKPASRMVTEFVDFTGRANAVGSVDIKPRVTGYLVKMDFKEGSEVKGPKDGKEGDLLFEIDPRPYQAQYNAAKAKFAQSTASLKLAQVTYSRFKDLAKKEPGAVSPLDLDKYRAQEDEAVANQELAKANMDSAKLNLDWTKVYAPIDGKISRKYLTLGNLVNADQTLVTTIVSLEPMYAYFDMDEPTYLRIKRAINDGRVKLHGDKGEFPVLLALQGEDGFEDAKTKKPRHPGDINFIDNQVFPTTGSIAWRGIFPNPKPNDKGTRLLAPGMFVRIRLPIGQEHKALLVIDRAIWSDQGLKNVYVVDDKNMVQSKRVTTGALMEDGLRVVEGLDSTDWVVVAALQQVRPRMEIKPEKLDSMPTLGSAPVAQGKKEE